MPFEGSTGPLFSAAAKLLFLNPLAPHLFAWSANQASVDRLLRGTGSKIDARGLDLYTRLFRNPVHVAGTLAMMANWRLEGMYEALRGLGGNPVFVVGAGDRAVPPGPTRRIAAAMPQALFESIAGTGHLAHEERPDLVADLIAARADAAGVAGRHGSP